MTDLLQQLGSPSQWIRRHGLRLLILALLLAAVLAPSCRGRGGDEVLGVSVDLSGSVALSSVGAAMTELERRAPSRLGAFGENSVEVGSVAELRSLELLDRAAAGARIAATGPGALHRDQTDLENALRAGMDLLPTDGSGRLLLLSDFNPTRGEVDAALDLAVRRRVRIDTLPLAPVRQAPRIVAFDLPTRVSVGNLSTGALAIDAGGPSRFRVELRIGESEPRLLPVDHPGGRLELPVELRFEEQGEVPVAVRLVPAEDDDGSLTPALPSRWRAAVRVEGSPRVLLAEDGPRTPLFQALEERGLDIERRSSSRLPERAADLDGFAVVLLHDVAAESLGERRMRAIADWVRAGGSLVFASGESSFGEGGYDDTPLVEVLPVTFEVREEKAEVALMISLDKSYSMKGEKMELAKEATKAALGELDDEHRFGVVAFDWNTFNIVPLQLAVNRDEIREQISRIEASAQTNFYPALESCFRQLAEIEDPTGRTVKHVILVSDGKTYPDDYEGLVRRMYDADITVSTVAVGLEADVELLQQIAEWGHGRSYFVQDAARVQKILLDEARSKLEDTLVEESTRVVTVGSHPVTAGIDLDGAPDLAGHVAYRPRPGAEVLLATGDDAPILARRRVGLGETWVFASDLSDRWSAPWLGWSGFAPLISQLLHVAAEGAFTSGDSVEVRRDDDRIEIRVQLHHPIGSGPRSGRPRDGAEVLASVGGAARERSQSLDQVGPGLYRGSAPVEPDPSGAIRVEVFVDGRSLAQRSIYFPGTDELSPLPADLGLAAAIAERTGGRAWQQDELPSALQPRPRDVTRAVPLWRWFLAAAILLYLIELALHRLGLLDPPLAEGGSRR